MSGEIHASLRSAMIADSRMIRDSVLDRLAAGGNGAWAQGFADYGELDGDGNAAELHRNNAGFIAGFDLPLGGGFRAGLAGAYAEQRAGVAARASRASGNTGYAIGYAGWQGGAWRLDMGGAYGWGTDMVTRTVAALGENESGSQDKRSGQVFARLGYDLGLSGFAAMPYLELAHVAATTGGFAENGGLAALSGAEKTDSQTFTALGLRLAMNDVKLGTMDFGLHADLGWNHALEGRTPAQAVAFATGQSFTVLGVPFGSDAAALQLGLDLLLAPDATLSVGYDGYLSSRGSSHALRGGLSLRF
jgi:outer membrane autotransporter protein